MLTAELIQLLVDECSREARAHWTYQALAEASALQSFDGCAKYFEGSSLEEFGHLRKFLRFLTDYGNVPVVMPPVQAVDVQSLSTPREWFTLALGLEIEVTRAINEIAAMASEQGQHEVRQFLDWFLAEQVSSVSEIQTIIRLLDRAWSDPAAIMAADERIGELAV